ncbi:MAG TPA: VIT1/CCC1 transporter family protein [bacterium]|nr:VIT1/CCC1 transporter family protein [bacterium]
MTEVTERIVLQAQRAEITEHYIYRNLANLTKDPRNRQILEEIAEDELEHYEFWQTHTGTTIKPKRWKIRFYTLLARLLGLTFAIRLMEAGEDLAQETYHEISREIPQAAEIEKDEMDHEEELIEMLDEELLQYAGSVVLGLNDALVELTGAIAGLTLALQNTSLVAIAALITGISAAFSMAGSEYLSTKTEDEGSRNPLKASVYTGVAYFCTVLVLVLPFFIVVNPFLGLLWTLINAILIILIFNYYISVAKAYKFARRFWEMVGISMGVAGISFLIGLGIRHLLGVEV